MSDRRGCVHSSPVYNTSTVIKFADNTTNLSLTSDNKHEPEEVLILTRWRSGKHTNNDEEQLLPSSCFQTVLPFLSQLL